LVQSRLSFSLRSEALNSQKRTKDGMKPDTGGNPNTLLGPQQLPFILICPIRLGVVGNLSVNLIISTAQRESSRSSQCSGISRILHPAALGQSVTPIYREDQKANHDWQ